MHRPDNLQFAGKPLEQADRVMVMVHGRGATADSILSLAPHLEAKNMAFVAPQATGNTWYPYSFLAPIPENEPGLSSGLEVLRVLVEQLATKGFSSKQIYLLGFSQGACLTLEFAARNPKRYGDIFGLSGGLIGPPGTPRDYPGKFSGTPVLLGCSDRDSHIPKERVLETDAVLTGMDAQVTTRLYPNAPHTIVDDEILFIKNLLAQPS